MIDVAMGMVSTYLYAKAPAHPPNFEFVFEAMEGQLMEILFFSL
jgi:hypothetical protein